MKTKKKVPSDKKLESLIHDLLVTAFMKTLPNKVKQHKAAMLKALKNK